MQELDLTSTQELPAPRRAKRARVEPPVRPRAKPGRKAGRPPIQKRPEDVGLVQEGAVEKEGVGHWSAFRIN